MRALCGAIIAAGALIGLGLASIGLGTRYQQYPRVDDKGNAIWIPFHLMDTPLITIVVLLVCCVVIGVGLAIVGLAYHHHRRHHEMLRLHDGRTTGTQLPVS
jgi:hypothetical protein